MMKKSSKAPLRIALYGMDNRSSKTMEMYLKGPCHGIAVVVGESEAEIDMIDADYASAREILETRKEKAPNRPIILLSIQHMQLDGAFYIKKPITVSQVEAVLAKIQAVIAHKSVTPAVKPGGTPLAESSESSAGGEAVKKAPEKMAMEVFVKKPPADKAQNDEQLKTSKHRTAMQLNEGGFTAFLGMLDDIDFEDKTNLQAASFDRRAYFLWFVQSAYQTAKQQDRVLQLKSIWKPITFFPDNREVWVDADDKQLRSFAGMKLTKAFAGSMTMALLDSVNARVERPMDKFQDFDAFIWKLAIWTSKGRFPVEVDLQRPIYLKRWPNFTRLVITPDALRIASLLIQAPRLPLEVVAILNCKPQYVFAFISACHALGLLGQYEQTAIPVKQAEAPMPAKKAKTGLLSKILNKLRGA